MHYLWLYHYHNGVSVAVQVLHTDMQTGAIVYAPVLASVFVCVCLCVLA